MPEQYRLAKLYRFLDALEPDARGCLIWPGKKTAKGYIVVALAVGVGILITAIMIICKNWYSIPRTLSDEGAHRFAYRDDRSARAFAVKPRASGAPLRGCGA